MALIVAGGWQGRASGSLASASSIVDNDAIVQERSEIWPLIRPIRR
jgi:hypothetical protein